MDRADSTPNEPEPPEPKQRATIKRRWAIMRSAGGGVAVIAVAGAIALGDPTDQADYSDTPGAGDSQISIES